MSEQDTEGQAQFYIGVDGGGTTCRARIEAADGRLLGPGAAGLATTRIGTKMSMQAVRTASEAAAIDAGLSPLALAQTSAGVGLAGMDSKGVLEAFLNEPHPFRNVLCSSDAKVACLGAHSGCDRRIVIVGTGSVGFARVKDRELRIGGYGFPVCDEGRGADLGLQAVQLALRAHDGRAVPSRFSSEIMERLAPEPPAVVAWSEQATVTEYAGLAPVVLDYAEAGDLLAEEILANGARQVDALVRFLVEFGASRISLLRGLATRVAHWLSRDVLQLLLAPDGDAVAGALLMAPGGEPVSSPQPSGQNRGCKVC